MVNYNNGKVYKIQPIMEHDENDIYIGSTTKKYLSQRLDNHRRSYKCWKRGICNKCMCFDIFDKYGIENCQILLIENVHANSKDELVSREGYYVRNMKCINKNIPDRSKSEYNKEYKKDNKDKIKLYKSEYRKNNKEIIKEKQHKYYADNKEIINKKIFCECGGHYTICHKARHFKSLKHQLTMELFERVNQIINNFHHQHYHLHNI
jgi:adenylate kinase family enzyme